MMSYQTLWWEVTPKDPLSDLVIGSNRVSQFDLPLFSIYAACVSTNHHLVHIVIISNTWKLVSSNSNISYYIWATTPEAANRVFDYKQGNKTLNVLFQTKLKTIIKNKTWQFSA